MTDSRSGARADRQSPPSPEAAEVTASIASRVPSFANESATSITDETDAPGRIASATHAAYTPAASRP